MAGDQWSLEGGRGHSISGFCFPLRTAPHTTDGRPPGDPERPWPSGLRDGEHPPHRTVCVPRWLSTGGGSLGLRGPRTLSPSTEGQGGVGGRTEGQSSSHGGGSPARTRPQGRGGGHPQPDGMSHRGVTPPSTDLKLVVWVSGFCGRRRQGRLCFRHTAGGHSFVLPKVSVLKILRTLWRVRRWVKGGTTGERQGISTSLLVFLFFFCGLWGFFFLLLYCCFCCSCMAVFL